jgi:hypothetical protein
MTLDDAPIYALARIRLLLRRWSYYKHLESVTLSGSHAKGTALRDSDMDLFLSLAPATPGPLAAVHASLADRFILYLPKRRNVSVRITLEGSNIDLVPGRRRPDSTHHILWQARHNPWLKTDIEKQIRYVRSSGFIDEILALKIWRRRLALRFPSFLMELATIHARPKDFRALLHFLATGFPTTRLLDPANSNNVVSDLLTEVEKLRIARRARLSLWGKWGLPTEVD